jgi:hypothetical protein
VKSSLAADRIQNQDPDDEVTTRQGNQLKMCEVNIQSLRAGDRGPTRTANVKLDQLRTILQHEHNFDVIGVTETWLTPTVTDTDINLVNYTVYRLDRTAR